MRTSPIHYIAPSAISIIPNCNGTFSDIAVTMASGARIKVYCRSVEAFEMQNGSYREWKLSGRNRRLSDNNAPYTIYARLSKSDDSAYLVFARQFEDDGKWYDRYGSHPSEEAPLGHLVYYPDKKHADEWYVSLAGDYWYVRLGEVTLPVDGIRTVKFDTGILGTDQYNEQWNLDPDSLPYRIEIANSKGVGVPFVNWGEDITLSAKIVEGWNGEVDEELVKRWTISRNTGDAEADDKWNHPVQDGEEEGEPADRIMTDRTIVLSHRHGSDDFNGAVAGTFVVTAWGEPEEEVFSDAEETDTQDTQEAPDAPDAQDGDGQDQPSLVPLATGSITILAETAERYELLLSADVMTYDPAAANYTPAGGIDIRVRCTVQDGSSYMMAQQQIEDAGLAVFCDPIDSEDDTDDRWLTFSNGTANIPVAAFEAGKSLNVHLMRIVETASSEDSEEETERIEYELQVTTVAYVCNGKDGFVGQSVFKSIMFCRMTSTPSAPTGGSFANPSPNAQAGTDADGTEVFWGDGIPAGDKQLWASSRVFTSDGKPPQQDSWSEPRKMTDTETYDVEFAMRQPNDAKPDMPNDGNRHKDAYPYGYDGQVWYDPSLDDIIDSQGTQRDWTDMYWRAEREIKNGVPGPWTVVRIKGEKGDRGIDGDHQGQIYQWSTLADGLSLTDEQKTQALPQGWSTDVPQRPSTEHYLWMAVTTVHADGTMTGWSDPIRISGLDGDAGADGSDMEFIFCLKDGPTTFSGNTHPANITIDKDNIQRDAEYIATHADFVPYGWTDNPEAVSKEHGYGYMSRRRRPAGSATWEPFGDPTVWSHWGRNGMDGDGVEYVFIRTTDNVAPVIGDAQSQEGYDQDDFFPQATVSSGYVKGQESGDTLTQATCTDDPVGTDDTWKFEWCAKRTKASPDADTGVRAWKPYPAGAMSLWGMYAESIQKQSETKYYAVNSDPANHPTVDGGTEAQAVENRWYGDRSKVVPLWTVGKILWTKTVIGWSDGSTTILYSAERNPNDGQAGQDIVVDGAAIIRYSCQQSNTVDPTTIADWTEYASVAKTKGWWLYTRTETRYKKSSDGTSAGSTFSYSVSYIAMDGNEGRAMTGMSEHYMASDKGPDDNGHPQTPTDGSDWTTDPNVPDGQGVSQWNAQKKYLWNYERVSYSSGTRIERTAARVVAVWTEDGNPGKGIDSIANFYKISTKDGQTSQNTELWPKADPDGAEGSGHPDNPVDTGWSATPVAPTADSPYLWNYERITWMDYGTGDRYTYSQPHVIGHYGRDGQSHDYHVTEYAWSASPEASASAGPTDATAWSQVIPAKPANKPYLWMRDKLMAWNSAAKSYTEGSFVYTRITGENGTGIKLSGSFTKAQWQAGHNSIESYLMAAHPSPETGECYIYSEDGHLWMWNGATWQDVGQFKGVDGESSYIHLAWCHDLYIVNGNIPEDWSGHQDETGFTTSKAAGEDYDYMGVLVNDTKSPDPGIEHAGAYKWNAVKGPQGESAYSADLSNEMDSVSTDDSGKVLSAQSVETEVSMSYGSTPVDITEVKVRRNGTLMTLGRAAQGVIVTWDGTTHILTVAYTTDATVSGKDLFTVSIVGPATVDKVLTVNAASGDRYNLIPSQSQIRVGRNGEAYVPNTFTLKCGYKVKHQGGTEDSVADASGKIGGRYYIYFRLRSRSTQQYEATLYRYGDTTHYNRITSTGINVADYDAVEFVLCTNTSSTISSESGITGIVDRETVPVVSDGIDGKTITKKSEAYRYAVNGDASTHPSADGGSEATAVEGRWYSDRQKVTPLWTAGKILWTETTITWSDNSTTTLYQSERNPNDGQAGQSVYITNQSVDYAASNSNSTPPSSGWTTYGDAISGISQGMWLWTRTTVTYNTGNPIVSYGVSYYSRDGYGAQYIYLKGTGSNRNAERELSISSSTNRITPAEYRVARGLVVTIIDRATLGIISHNWFDVYGGRTSSSSSDNATMADRLRADFVSLLDRQDDSVFVAITSYDAVGFNDDMVAKLREFGLGYLEYTAVTGVGGYRTPFAFLGYKGLQQGYALCKMEGAGANDPYAEVMSYVANGAFMSSKDGRSIVSVSEHYQASTNSSGLSTPTQTDWGTNPMPSDWNKDKPYLWNYEKIVYSDGTVERTTASVVAIWTKDGKGIDSITNYYLATSASSDVTTSTSGWTPSIQSVTSDKPYLWNYEVIVYTDGTSKTIAPHIIGHYGKDGESTVIYQILLDGSLFYGDDETIHEDITAKIYKIEGNTRTAYNPSRSQLSLYHLRADGSTDAVPNIDNINDGFTLSGNTVRTKIYDNDGFGNERAFVIELSVPGYGIVKASIPYTMNGGDGTNGKDGITITVTPPALILSQSTTKSGDSYPIEGLGTPSTKGDVFATITAKRGGTDLTIGVQGFLHKINCDARYSGGSTSSIEVWLTSVTTTNGNSKGYVDINLTIDGKTYTINIPWYVNLLGTWKQSVEGGVETITAQKISYVLKEGSTASTLDELKQEFNSVRDASRAFETWKSSSADGGYANLVERITTAQSIATTAKTTVDNLDVVSRNLVMNGAFNIGENLWLQWGSPTTREIVESGGKKWMHIVSNTSQWQGYQQNHYSDYGITVEGGKEYTISLKAYSASGTPEIAVGFHWFAPGSSAVESQSWPSWRIDTTKKTYSATITVPSGVDHFNIMVGDAKTVAQEFYITDIKLEKGSKASEWTPSTEEATEQISSIVQTSEQISLNVESGYFNFVKYPVAAFSRPYDSSLVTGTNPVLSIVDGIYGKTLKVNVRVGFLAELGYASGYGILQGKTVTMFIMVRYTGPTSGNTDIIKMGVDGNWTMNVKYQYQQGVKVSGSSPLVAPAGRTSIVEKVVDLDNFWYLCSVTGKLSSVGSTLTLHNCNQACQVFYCGLVEGENLPPLSNILNGAALMRSGLQINAECIEATTDNFRIKNNKGIQTCGIDSDGFLDVTGGMNVRDADKNIKLKVNGGETSISENGEITIVDAKGLYVKRGNEGFRLTTSGFQRWNPGSNSWVPFYASRYVRTITLPYNTSVTLNAYDDFVLVKCSSSYETKVYMPSSGVSNGKIISIVNIGTADFEVYGSIMGKNGTLTQAKLNPKDRFEMVYVDGTWYTNYMSYLEY